MNARQKAKYYKKALENYNHITNVPREIYLDRTQLKHYKMSFRIDSEVILNDPNTAIKIVRDHIFRQCVPIICNNIRQTDYPLSNCFLYECDIWAKH